MEIAGIEDTDDYIKLCLFIDFYRCIWGLNHTVNVHTKEGVAFLIVMCRFWNTGEMLGHKELGRIKDDTTELIGMLPLVYQCSEDIGGKHELIVPKAMKQHSDDAEKEYRRKIYNLCRIVAGMDNQLEEVEEEYLKEVALLDD